MRRNINESKNWWTGENTSAWFTKERCKMGIRILKGGMMTTVQDLGRTGYQSQGFSVAGVMDVRSFKIANLLLDNPENEAVLEMTLIGPTLEFTSATIIAITGGDFQPTINGEPAPMYTALYMNKGDILKFGSARTGSRGYIAFSSYLDVPVVMGSRCTNMKSKLGGFKGRKLQAGDYMNFRIKRRYLPFFLSRKLDLNEFDQEEAELRVVMGPQDDVFSKQGIETFLNSEYIVTSDFDRMGCRLEGPFIAPKETSDIIPTVLPSAPYRCLPTGSRSSFWRTVRLQAATQRSLQWHLWTYQSWYREKPTIRSVSRPLPSRRPSACAWRR